MKDFFEKTIQCPYCAEHISVTLDASAGDQDYIEDCSVCCHPMHLVLTCNEQTDEVELSVSADDEQIF
ncbi:CPXCG motif-containing cysteine-rich protein [Oceanisphaera pacifica]|uniref:CPXCG motif-containing cysteine-rich protein n=1 Tax=Oceanisphaera pacifica TaxID=2818389 RepID=A0ABS3NGH7_9GAMM|nr:CPXCG motif-containing cysteine-rich protein [Oceanisphaera pacifica]MBO1519437.1 CPXCG motif-containing cysteine-rich protein [Oceanisphaera pacifica]